MKKERKEDSFLKKPWYKGGNKALQQVIYGQLEYPQEALKEKIEGVVRLRLDIDYTGKVVGAKTIQGLGFGCDEEAIRVAKKLEFEVAKSPRKLKVTFHKNLNIQFTLPKGKTKSISPKPSLNYNYTIKSPKKKESQKIYTYQVNWPPSNNNSK